MANKVTPAKFDPTPENFEALANQCSQWAAQEFKDALRAAASLAREFQTFKQTHAGDTISLSGEIDQWKERAQETEREVAELREEISEVRNNNLRGMELERNRYRQQAEAAERKRDDERADARRYRWLRSQHWTTGKYCVLRKPKQSARLGAYLPSGERLDELIDAEIAATADKGEDNES